jgi:CLIP-associating protein 1/2
MSPLQMHQENGLQFRSFVPTLMELLEDADGMVRDVARNTVIELFQYVDINSVYAGTEIC